MSESKMDYRGSKSGIIPVKEQRVDGSWGLINKPLRCTLMGFERSYQTKILTKQLNKLSFSTMTHKEDTKLNPW
jgi:hypothetical protein